MSNFYRKKGSAVAAFIKDKSFYIILIASIIMVCVAGYLAITWNTESEPAPEDNQVNTNDTPYDGETPTWPDNEDQNVNSNVPDVPDDSQTQSPSVTEPDDNEPVIVNYTQPVIGNIKKEFSGTTPVFSETLQDWRLHQGIDYTTEGSANVYAAANGIVEDIYNDGLMGVTVVIKHADGVRTIYQSLSENPKVLKGSEIIQGDLLGTTDKTADAECSDGEHLHFAALKDGKYINPQELFNPDFSSGDAEN